MSQLCATPYDITASFFYFDSFDEYKEKQAAARNGFGMPVEEFEIQYIDGDNPLLFEAAGINQGNLARWFDELDHIDDGSEEGLCLRWLLSNGNNLDYALEHYEDCILHRGRLSEYAGESLEELLPPELKGSTLSRYLDDDAYARDLQAGGDAVEIERDVWIVNANSM